MKTVQEKRLTPHAVEPGGQIRSIPHPVGLSDVGRDEVPIFGADSTFADGTQNIGLPTLFSVAGRSRLLSHIGLRPLDEVLPEDQRVDVTKVDVEGAELAVLKGAAGTIQREKPAIIFEANADTCEAGGYSVEVLLEWLGGQGYEVSVIGMDGELTPEAIYAFLQYAGALPRSPGS